jgi:DNA-binding GntR family transcriptional regulator
MRPAPHRLAGERVYVILKQEISTGVHAGGVRLREQDLSQRFGVSRTPVREALKRLTAEGLVGVGEGNGLVVRIHSVEEIIDTYVVHEVVQALAARLAAERGSEVDVFRLETLLDECERALDSGQQQRAAELTTNFEHALRDVARNSKLSAVIEFLHASLAPTGPLDGASRIREQLDEHKKIVAAIKAHDPEAAGQASNAHIKRSRDHRMTTLLRSTGPRPPA